MEEFSVKMLKNRPFPLVFTESKKLPGRINPIKARKRSPGLFDFCIFMRLLSLQSLRVRQNLLHRLLPSLQAFFC